MFFEGELEDIEDYLDKYVGGIQINTDYLVPAEDFDSTVSFDHLYNNLFNLDESLNEEVIEYDHGIGFI